MVWALILTLSASGQFEIRTEGKFESTAECVQHLTWRAPQLDFTRGNVLMRCMPQEELEAMMRSHFGGRA